MHLPLLCSKIESTEKDGKLLFLSVIDYDDYDYDDIWGYDWDGAARLRNLCDNTVTGSMLGYARKPKQLTGGIFK